MRRRRSNPLFTEDRSTHAKAVARRILAMYLEHRVAVVTSLLFGVVIAASAAVGPLLIGRAVDRFLLRGDAIGFLVPVALLLVSYATGFVARVIQTIVAGTAGQKMIAKLRSQMFATLQRQSMSFFDHQDSGDLQSRLVNDIDVVNQVIAGPMTQTLASVLSAVGMMIGMFLMNWRLALVTFLLVPIIPPVTRLFVGRARTQYRKTRQTIGDVSANLQEDIAGVRVSQAFNRTGVNRQRFAARNRANRDANVQARVVSLAFSPTMDMLSAISIGAVISYGGYLAINHEVTVGVIVAFLGYTHQFFGPVQQLAAMFPQVQTALAAAERIFDLVDAPVAISDPPNPIPLGPISGRIEFENVEFEYEPGHPVLRGIDFIVEPGQTVAIVGPTGAGKTTIISLLARLYDVTAGRITVDGVDVRDLKIGELRRQLGVVPQNSFLFNTSIRENIRFGRLDATDAEVEAAAKLARAHQFIHRLPLGYDTRVGERASHLSQGQRQLVAIARVLLANPRIMILDEATSSVDSRTEVLIQSSLADLLDNRTSVVIAHRLSTIRSADVVLVVDDGEIVERGSHVELLARGGLYSDLYRRQFRDSPAIMASA